MELLQGLNTFSFNHCAQVLKLTFISISCTLIIVACSNLTLNCLMLCIEATIVSCVLEKDNSYGIVSRFIYFSIQSLSR